MPDERWEDMTPVGGGQSWESMTPVGPSGPPPGYRGVYQEIIRPTIEESARDIGRQAMGAGRDVFNLGMAPFRMLGTLGAFARDIYREPGKTLTEAVKGVPRAAGEMLYGAVRPLVMPLTERKFPSSEEVRQYLVGTAVPAAIGAVGPRAIEALGKAPGRYLSLPAERHATGAAMMERIPARFGVDDAAVSQAYNQAERLSVASMTQAPLMNFRKRLEDMRAQWQGTPLTAFRDTGAMRTLDTALNELGARNNTMTPRQVNATIKAVNHHIGSATDNATRGMWKQILGALHQDMQTAAVATGDPAFQAFERATHLARMNFLKEDLRDVINSAGILTQRTGGSVITSPGKIVQWMQKNPEWVEGVEKARPGLLNSIRQDLQEIVPITDITGRSIPGQRYGSGRLLLAASAGHLIGRLLNLPIGLAESIGAMMGGLAGHTGFSITPGRIERSFRPVRTPVSPRGGILGGLAGGLFQTQRPPEEAPE